MAGLNCWEYKHCGRQPGGAKVGDLGVCPASLDRSSQGTNGGNNGGRFCWYVAGTFCGGTVQGSFAQKKASCMSCEFYKVVRVDEGASFVLTR